MSDKIYQVHLVKTAETSPPSKTYQVRLEEITAPPGDVKLDKAQSPGALAGSNGAPQSSDKLEDLWKFEYERAQEMLQHYDNLTWHIGSIFIAGILVLTGLGLGKDGFEILAKGWRSLLVVFGIPGISFLVLVLWALWFKRMRSHYRFRDEVLHRLEEKLKIYHFLRIAETNRNTDFLLDDDDGTLKLVGRYPITIKVSELENDEYKNGGEYDKLCDVQKKAVDKKLAKEKELIIRLSEAKKAAWKMNEKTFKPLLYVGHSGPSSYILVGRLAVFIPVLQLLVLFLIWFFNMTDRTQNYLYPQTWQTMYGELSKGLLVIPWLIILLTLILAFMWLKWWKSADKSKEAPGN